MQVFYPEVGAAVVQEALKNKASLEGRAFFGSSVAKNVQMKCEIEQRFLIMNDLEFSKAFAYKPRVKDPRCPKLHITAANGSVEQVHVFRDEAHPCRSLQLVTAEGSEQQTKILDAGEHVHLEQADRVLLHSVQARQHTSGEENLVSSIAWASLSTTSEPKETMTPCPMMSYHGPNKKHVILGKPSPPMLFFVLRTRGIADNFQKAPYCPECAQIRGLGLVSCYILCVSLDLGPSALGDPAGL